MAFTNLETKEVNCKILYFGPAGAGKRESLRSVYRESSDEVRSGMMEIEDLASPFRYFDFLPVSLGHIRDYHLKLHLFSLPLSGLFESVNQVIVRGLDGIVFVADSRIDRLAANIETMQEVRSLLKNKGIHLSELAHAIQYNKRDLADISPVDILKKELNPSGLPDFETIASRSVGTMETLRSMARQILLKLAP